VRAAVAVARASSLAVGAAAASLAAVSLVACTPSDVPLTRRAARAPYVNTDSMGVAPARFVAIPLEARPELVENSAAALSHTQPGVFFTVNDSGNDPWLFALDTTGADRGVWRVRGTSDVDWESASVGPCVAAADSASKAPDECVYIGDTGDNGAKRPARVIYRVSEPRAEHAGFMGDVTAQPLIYSYADGPHDVEAMYVAPNADTYLITKRRLADAAGRLRPALVFRLPADAWGRGVPAIAQIVDSLPIVPGSAPLRFITDASLSPDARYLAVRTYAQVYVFATDSLTGRVIHEIPPAVCNTINTGQLGGEGVTWFGRGSMLLLTAEGRESPMYAVECPMPRSGP
jgi:hypothetical protein